MPTREQLRTNVGLATELRFSVMRLRRRLVRERHPDNDLSLPSMAVLWALHRLGDLTVGALAAREQVRPPSMTRTVNCLADAGLVERQPPPPPPAARGVVDGVRGGGRGGAPPPPPPRDRWLSRRLEELTPAERDVLRQAAPNLQRIAAAD